MLFVLARRSLHRTRDIRNVAIVAHVDHGKTSLVDCLLRHDDNAGRLADQPRMDYNQLERERGITILSKCTTVDHRGHRINIVDTPGHSDFGGEVERALALVDGIVLVVDATDGPMVQTRSVLGLSLKRGLRPIVVFNKMDRGTERSDEVDSEVFDLFSGLGATDEQLSYTAVYASAKEAWAGLRKDERGLGMLPLLDAIIRLVPPPAASKSPLFSMLVNAMDQSAFLGQSFFGKVASGSVRVADAVKVLSDAGATTAEDCRINQIFVRKGATRVEVQEAIEGDIVSVNGPPAKAVQLNYTICDRAVAEPLVPFSVNPPTVSMLFYLNDSPMAGREGKSLTSRMLFDRISAEAGGNLSMQVRPTESADCFEVLGRGEMQLCVLAESIRREGYELAISRPRVVCRTVGGRLHEPVAEVVVDCPAECMGAVIEKMSKRKGDLLRSIDIEEARLRMTFRCPVRGLIGYSSEFKNDTHGAGTISFALVDYEPHRGPIEGARKGALIATASGVCTRWALSELDARGTLFVDAGTPVYEGMVVGESARAADIEVNPCRSKELSNYRTVLKEDGSRAKAPRSFALEDLVAYMNEDELVELTPKATRLRCRVLSSSERKRHRNSNKQS